MNTFRSGETLKRLYENKKKELRRKLGDEKKQRLLTGGGIMQSDKLDNIEVLISILNEKTLTGLSNEFDCDADQTIAREAQTNYVFEFDMQEYENETDAQGNNECNEGLDKQMGEECNEGLDKQMATNECGIQNWKKLKIDNLKTPLTTALRVDVDAPKYKDRDNEEKGSKSRVTSRLSNRRRPMLTRALTSSDVAQKYNLLLDKRLELINKNLAQQDEHFKFQKEEQELKLQLIKLEIEYKKTLLKSNFGIDCLKF